jgi:P27 family predicted phage terminase small subunit
MGRPAKSEALHDLQGTGLRSNLAESHVAGALPRPPKFLSKDAKKKFRQLVKQLAERRAVTAGDADLIAIYCGTWERLQQALENIREEGLIVTYTRLDSGGNPHDVERPNISLKIVEVSERACLSYLARLGLTPRDRELVRPTAPVSTGKEQTEAERLDAEIAALEQQEAVAEPAAAEEEDLLSTVNLDDAEPLSEKEALLREADALLNEENDES